MTDFEKMYAGSWYTIIGTGGDEAEWKNGYQDMLKDVGTIREWVAFTGDEMNRYYELTDNNAYPCDLHFLAFPLDGLDVEKLAIFKLIMQDRWFDDIVANNAARQKEIDRKKGVQNALDRP